MVMVILDLGALKATQKAIVPIKISICVNKF